MLNGLKQAGMSLSRVLFRVLDAHKMAVNRALFRAVDTYMWSVTSRNWLNHILGVFFLVISITLAVLIIAEIGRETGLWIPGWNRQEVGKPLPGWAISIYYAAILITTTLRSYYFFRPLKRS